MIHPITEHVAKTARHTSFYLACGPADGTPIIFVHGWPELSLSWRHQLPVLAALGQITVHGRVNRVIGETDAHLAAPVDRETRHTHRAGGIFGITSAAGG